MIRLRPPRLIGVALLAAMLLPGCPLPARGNEGTDAGTRKVAASEIPLAVIVALKDGQPVVDKDWVDEQIEKANQLYANVPLHFRRVSLVPAAFVPADLLLPEDRDRATANLVAGAVNLRVVASLMDIDEPGRVRRGVHWHLRADRRRHCILLSAISGPSILAHELGHFFGNGHSPVTDNLMSYSRSGGDVALDRQQEAVARRTAQEYFRTGELSAVPAATGSRSH